MPAPASAIVVNNSVGTAQPICLVVSRSSEQRSLLLIRPGSMTLFPISVSAAPLVRADCVIQNSIQVAGSPAYPVDTIYAYVSLQPMDGCCILVFASSSTGVTRRPELLVEFEVLGYSTLPQREAKNVACCYKKT